MKIQDKIQADREDMKLARRLVRQAIRANGGSWLCPGKCGRRISANKAMCASCAPETPVDYLEV